MSTIDKSHSIYTKSTLSIYDFWVHYISNSYAWKCSRSTLLNHYNYCLSDNHLDVGVGTGYFLKKYTFQSKKPRIGLMDLNDACLRKSAHKIQKHNPTIYKRDILKEIDFEDRRYDSISLNYVMHCLPSNFAEKGIVFKNLQKILTQDGVLFGSTILNKGVKKNKFARLLIDTYNKKGIFHNLTDSEESLRRELLKYFNYVHIQIEGTVALFVAKNYRLFTKLEV